MHFLFKPVLKPSILWWQHASLHALRGLRRVAVWLLTLITGLLLGLLLLAAASALALRFWGAAGLSPLLNQALNKSLNSHGIELRALALGQVSKEGINVKHLALDYYVQNTSTDAQRITSHITKHQITLNDLNVTFKTPIDVTDITAWHVTALNAAQLDRVVVQFIDHHYQTNATLPAHIRAQPLGVSALPASDQAWSFKPEYASLMHWFDTVILPLAPNWFLGLLPQHVSLQQVNFQTPFTHANPTQPSHQARLNFERTANQHATLHADVAMAQWFTPIRLAVLYQPELASGDNKNSIKEHYQIELDTGNQLANLHFNTHRHHLNALNPPTYTLNNIDFKAQLFNLDDPSLLNDLKQWAPELFAQVLKPLTNSLAHHSFGLQLQSPQWPTRVEAQFDTPFTLQLRSQNAQDHVCLSTQGQLNQQANGQIDSLRLTHGQLSAHQQRGHFNRLQLHQLKMQAEFMATITPQNLTFEIPLTTLTVGALNASTTLNATQNKVTLNHLTGQLSLQGFVPKPHSVLNMQLTNAHIAHGLELTLPDQTVTIKQLTTQLNTVSLQHTNTSANWADFMHHLTLSTDYEVAANNLKHPALLTQNWQTEGVFKMAPRLSNVQNNLQSQTADLIDYSATGALSNTAGLLLHHQTQGTIKNSVNVVSSAWQLAESDFLSGNALAKTLSAWPGLLTLTQGAFNITGQSRLNLTSNSPLLAKLQTSAQLNLKGLSGVYNQTAFTNASTQIEVTLQQGQLSLSSQTVHVQSALHAVPFGPIDLRGRYQLNLTNLNTPLPGLVTVDYAKASVFKGHVSLLPFTWSLNQPANLAITLDKIDLNPLLHAYTANQSTNQPGELQGQGTLNGYLPVRLSLVSSSTSPSSSPTIKPTVSVEHGLISSTQGGQLQYRPSNSAQLAATHSSMGSVLKVLSDFHYSELTAQVTLHPNGQLTLGFSIKGQNPAIEDGRPIHLNINIDEDLPALITSLQIANQVSQTIQKRLEQKLLKQRTSQ